MTKQSIISYQEHRTIESFKIMDYHENFSNFLAMAKWEYWHSIVESIFATFSQR